MARCRILPVLMLLLVVCATTAGAQSGCETRPDGSVVCDYDGGDDTAAAGDGGSNGSFWTSGTAEALYAGLGIFVAVAGALYAQQRLKSGRRTMYRYLRTTDQLLHKAKEDPIHTIPEIERMRLEIQSRHEQAKLEDAQFLELDKRLARGLVLSRMRLLERNFPQLPRELMEEIQHIMSDEVFSRSDLESLEQKAERLQVPTPVRRDLKDYLTGWLRTETAAQGALDPANNPEISRNA